MMSDYGVGALGGVVLIDPETGLPYKAEGGGGGGGAQNSLVASDLSVTVAANDGGSFSVSAITGENTGSLMILNPGNGYIAVLADGEGPLDSSSNPAGIVLHADLDLRVPTPPPSGTYTLQSVDGVVSWVSTD